MGLACSVSVRIPVVASTGGLAGSLSSGESSVAQPTSRWLNLAFLGCRSRHLTLAQRRSAGVLWRSLELILPASTPRPWRGVAIPKVSSWYIPQIPDSRQYPSLPTTGISLQAGPKRVDPLQPRLSAATLRRWRSCMYSIGVYRNPCVPTVLRA
jgi:hypothetical protein